MDLDVVFLGTGGSVPSARRNTAGVLVRRGGDRILIDAATNRPLALAEPVVAVRDPRPDGFTLEAYLLVTLLGGAADALTPASFDAWRVVWMGVE